MLGYEKRGTYEEPYCHLSLDTPKLSYLDNREYWVLLPVPAPHGWGSLWTSPRSGQYCAWSQLQIHSREPTGMQDLDCMHDYLQKIGLHKA